MRINTIGYGGRPPGEFLDLLQSEGVRTVVDVRLRPDRASFGSYQLAKSPDKGIVRLLEVARIEYVSLVELGNVFLGLTDWAERYRSLLERSGDLLTQRLSELKTPFCMMCAEKQVTGCHRLLIAEYLARRGYEVTHIDGA